MEPHNIFPQLKLKYLYNKTMNIYMSPVGTRVRIALGSRGLSQEHSFVWDRVI